MSNIPNAGAPALRRGGSTPLSLTFGGGHENAMDDGAPIPQPQATATAAAAAATAAPASTTASGKSDEKRRAAAAAAATAAPQVPSSAPAAAAASSGGDGSAASFYSFAPNAAASGGGGGGGAVPHHRRSQTPSLALHRSNSMIATLPAPLSASAIAANAAAQQQQQQQQQQHLLPQQFQMHGSAKSRASKRDRQKPYHRTSPPQSNTALTTAVASPATAAASASANGAGTGTVAAPPVLRQRTRGGGGGAAIVSGRSSSDVQQHTYPSGSDTPRASHHSMAANAASGNMLYGTEKYKPQLPLCQPKCQSISADTAASLILGEFNHLYDSILFIDCRFFYEYAGGHIQNAINIAHPLELERLLFTNPRRNGSRIAIVLHCEFSQKRGPHAWEAIRNQDRSLHASDEKWNDLFYPELYLLHQGYKFFFSKFPNLCTPATYQPMDDARFSAAQSAAERCAKYHKRTHKPKREVFADIMRRMNGSQPVHSASQVIATVPVPVPTSSPQAAAVAAVAATSAPPQLVAAAVPLSAKRPVATRAGSSKNVNASGGSGGASTGSTPTNSNSNGGAMAVGAGGGTSSFDSFTSASASSALQVSSASSSSLAGLSSSAISLSSSSSSSSAAASSITAAAPVHPFRSPADFSFDTFFAPLPPNLALLRQQWMAANQPQQLPHLQQQQQQQQQFGSSRSHSLSHHQRSQSATAHMSSRGPSPFTLPSPQSAQPSPPHHPMPGMTGAAAAAALPPPVLSERTPKTVGFATTPATPSPEPFTIGGLFVSAGGSGSGGAASAFASTSSSSSIMSASAGTGPRSGSGSMDEQLPLSLNRSESMPVHLRTTFGASTAAASTTSGHEHLSISVPESNSRMFDPWADASESPSPSPSCSPSPSSARFAATGGGSGSLSKSGSFASLAAAGGGLPPETVALLTSIQLALSGWSDTLSCQTCRWEARRTASSPAPYGTGAGVSGGAMNDAAAGGNANDFSLDLKSGSGLAASPDTQREQQRLSFLTSPHNTRELARTISAINTTPVLTSTAASVQVPSGSPTFPSFSNGGSAGLSAGPVRKHTRSNSMSSSPLRYHTNTPVTAGAREQRTQSPYPGSSPSPTVAFRNMHISARSSTPQPQYSTHSAAAAAASAAAAAAGAGSGATPNATLANSTVSASPFSPERGQVNVRPSSAGNTSGFFNRPASPARQPFGAFFGTGATNGDASPGFQFSNNFGSESITLSPYSGGSSAAVVFTDLLPTPIAAPAPAPAPAPTPVAVVPEPTTFAASSFLVRGTSLRRPVGPTAAPTFATFAPASVPAMPVPTPLRPAAIVAPLAPQVSSPPSPSASASGAGQLLVSVPFTRSTLLMHPNAPNGGGVALATPTAVMPLPASTPASAASTAGSARRIDFNSPATPAAGLGLFARQPEPAYHPMIAPSPSAFQPLTSADTTTVVPAMSLDASSSSTAAAVAAAAVAGPTVPKKTAKGGATAAAAGVTSRRFDPQHSNGGSLT